MTFDTPSSGSLAPEPRPQAVPVAEGRTLTLRLGAAAARGEAMEGSLLVPVAHPSLPTTLHAGVVEADATPLTLTFFAV